MKRLLRKFANWVWRRWGGLEFLRTSYTAEALAALKANTPFESLTQATPLPFHGGSIIHFPVIYSDAPSDPAALVGKWIQWNRECEFPDLRPLPREPRNEEADAIR